MFDPDSMPRWIKNYMKNSLSTGAVIAGVNDDDCATILTGSALTVITTDFINAWPIAEQLNISTNERLGALIVKNNISDLCGSGAKPVAILLGITLTRDSEERTYKEIIKGAYSEAEKYNIPIVGGDSKLGPSRALMGVAVGSATDQRCLFFKNGAKQGDTIWVSGPLGSCTAATLYLNDNSKLGLQGWAKRAILDPKLPLHLSRSVSELKIGNGGTDISDGLAADLSNLCHTSGVSAVIFPEKIPVAQQVRSIAAHFNIPPWLFSFGSGGDLQFIVTTASNHNDMESLGFTAIGKICKGEGLYLEGCKQRRVAIKALGHKDSRKASFADEAWLLIKSIGERWSGLDDNC